MADYLTRLHADPAAIDAQAWDALLARQPSPTPFMRHAHLVALHASGSAVPATGWSPCFLTLERDGALAAACALYLKAHSYGEYVFDWAWAEACERAGLAYYPKLLGAVPFTPVTGTRLLAHDAAARAALVQAIGALATTLRLSSAHVLFVDDTDRDAFARAGWLLREGVQFHWQAPADGAPADFDALLRLMQRDKRKKIVQERRRVAEAGVSFTAHRGDAIDAGLWDYFHHCYTLTYRAHGSTPYLSRRYFAEQARGGGAAHWLMFVASRAGRRIAASLVAVDDARRTAWGRYWGCTEPLPGLHFEACYYQPLAWCLHHGYQRFEGGAQGEHKMARGLLPVRTVSAHWLREPRLARAVAAALAHEGTQIAGYLDALGERSPFRPAPAEP
jgi:predicted N-acyltransferase